MTSIEQLLHDARAVNEARAAVQAGDVVGADAPVLAIVVGAIVLLLILRTVMRWARS